MRMHIHIDTLRQVEDRFVTFGSYRPYACYDPSEIRRIYVLPCDSCNDARIGCCIRTNTKLMLDLLFRLGQYVVLQGCRKHIFKGKGGGVGGGHYRWD